MQFRVRDYERIAAGELTLTFRRWRRPQARAGGRYRIGAGVLEVDEVRPIDAGAITQEEARAAGYESAEEVLEAIERNRRRGSDGDAPLYRIAFHYAGVQADRRMQLAADDALSGAQMEELSERLNKLDERSRRGAWTAETLAAIGRQPGRRAADLAAAQGCETARFKADVRKLKALGLTLSLEVGYRLSPRGAAVLAVLQERA